MSIGDKAIKAIKAHVESLMSERVKTLTNAAKMDLYFGPFSVEDYAEEGVDWPGYISACAEVQAFADDMPTDLWYDIQFDAVTDREPEGFTDEETGEYVEPEWEDYYKFEARDIKRAVFGELIGNGVN